MSSPPGAAPLPVLGADVLVALGKRPGGLVAEEVSRRGWELAGMWLRAERDTSAGGAGLFVGRNRGP